MHVNIDGHCGPLTFTYENYVVATSFVELQLCHDVLWMKNSFAISLVNIIHIFRCRLLLQKLSFFKAKNAINFDCLRAFFNGVT